MNPTYPCPWVQCAKHKAKDFIAKRRNLKTHLEDWKAKNVDMLQDDVRKELYSLIDPQFIRDNLLVLCPTCLDILKTFSRGKARSFIKCCGKELDLQQFWFWDLQQAVNDADVVPIQAPAYLNETSTYPVTAVHSMVQSRATESPEIPEQQNPSPSMDIPDLNLEDVLSFRPRLLDLSKFSLEGGVKRLYSEALLHTIEIVNRCGDDGAALYSLFHKSCLWIHLRARRRSRKKSINDQIRHRLQRWIKGEYVALWNEAINQAPRHSTLRPTVDPTEPQVIRRIIFLTRYNRYGDAMRILTDENICDISDPDVLSKLKRKLHTQSLFEDGKILDELVHSMNEAGENYIPVQDQDIFNAISSCKKGLASGPTGSSMDLFKIAISVAKQKTELHPLVQELSVLIENILNGHSPLGLKEILTRGFVFPIGSKARPIIVDDVLTKICSKILSAKILQNNVLPQSMIAYQKAFSKRGMEDVFFSLDQQIRDTRESITVSLDIENGYNSINRSRLFEVVAKWIPSALPYVQWQYGHATTIQNGDISLQFARGIKQGDPLAPILFSLCLHEVIEQLPQDLIPFVFAYLDDIYLCGSGKQCEDTVHWFKRGDGSKLLALYGLKISDSKGQGYWPPDVPDTQSKQNLSADLTLSNDGLIVLGSPLGSDEFVISFLSVLANKHKTFLQKLDIIPHCGIQFNLARKCCGVPLVNHVLRTIDPTLTISYGFKFAITIDTETALFINRTLGVQLELWQIFTAQLPSRLGGKGFTSAGYTALPAFISATEQASNISHHNKTALSNARQNFQKFLRDNKVLKVNEACDAKSQKQLTQMMHDANFNHLMTTMSFPDSMKHRICAQSAVGASGWTEVDFHNESFSPIIPHNLFSILIKQSLGFPFAQQNSSCPFRSKTNLNCGSFNDVYLRHTEACSTRFQKRHDRLVSEFCKILSENGIDYRKEVRVNDENQQRPGDVYFWTLTDNWTEYFLDFSVVLEVVSTKWSIPKKEVGTRAVSKMEKDKIAFYRESFQHIQHSAKFIPCVCSTSGTWGKESLNAFLVVARHIAAIRFTSVNEELKKIRTRLSSVVMYWIANDIQTTLRIMNSSNLLSI